MLIAKRWLLANQHSTFRCNVRKVYLYIDVQNYNLDCAIVELLTSSVDGWYFRNTVETIPKSNRKIVENSASLTPIYMNAHFAVLEQSLQ